MKSFIEALILSLILITGLAACSSSSDEREAQEESCEQVKEFEEVYKECLEEAKKVRN